MSTWIWCLASRRGRSPGTAAPTTEHHLQLIVRIHPVYNFKVTVPQIFDLCFLSFEPFWAPENRFKYFLGYDFAELFKLFESSRLSICSCLKHLRHRGVYCTVPKVIDFPRYKMKCSGENLILHGIFHVVSDFMI